MDITAKIQIDASDFNSLSDAIKNDIIDHIKDEAEEFISDDLTDRVKDSVLECFDIHDEIDNWFSNNFCIEDHLSNVDLSEYYEINVDDEARSLLENYSPGNHCRTGDAFTDAVERAVRYLCLRDDEFADDLIRALDRVRKNKEISQVVKENKEFWISDAKPKIIQEFKQELEQYFKDLELQKAKELLGVNENEASIVPINNFNTNIA